jgi:hypothetical protein
MQARSPICISETLPAKLSALSSGVLAKESGKQLLQHANSLGIPQDYSLVMWMLRIMR